MFRIGVVSDTHHDWQTACKAMGKLGKLDLICHGGDMFADGINMGQLLRMEVKVVAGNCDFRADLPAEQVFMIGKKKILLTHGHKYRVKTGFQAIFYRAQELQADIVIFGHTHVPACFQKHNIIFLNPGSPVDPRGNSKASYGLIEVGAGRVKTKIFTDGS